MKKIFSFTLAIALILIASSSTTKQSKQREEPAPDFVDSTQIGAKGMHKIDIQQFQEDSYAYIQIRFYQKRNKDWVETQNNRFHCLYFFDPQILDYNNDGFNDISWISEIAMRGANELRTLCIYDKEKEQMVYIRNSQDYPNISYNTELDCLDSHAFYGGSTTYFLRLQGDSLFRFAEVSLFDKEREVNIYDDAGIQTNLLHDTLGDPEEVYTRFLHFDPKIIFKE